MMARDRYLRHGKWSAPGDHCPAIEALPDDLHSLLTAVRGLFVHCDYLELYDLTPEDVAEVSRETLSVSERLSQILSKDASSLALERHPRDRTPGTCRDYALMLCSFAREKNIPARVRCGFARYFVRGFFHDHWICEYWNEDTARWCLADAQLDAETRQHLGVEFETDALPEWEFLTSDKAWNLWKSGQVIGAEFGHGAADGAWFLVVNLARDLLALQMREVSDWDGWRDAATGLRKRQPVDLDVCDAMADLIAQVDTQHDALDQLPAMIQEGLGPFWMSASP